MTVTRHWQSLPVTRVRATAAAGGPAGGPDSDQPETRSSESVSIIDSVTPGRGMGTESSATQLRLEDRNSVVPVTRDHDVRHAAGGHGPGRRRPRGRRRPTARSPTAALTVSARAPAGAATVVTESCQ
jgi:hypothetical protein